MVVVTGWSGGGHRRVLGPGRWGAWPENLQGGDFRLALGGATRPLYQTARPVPEGFLSTPLKL